MTRVFVVALGALLALAGLLMMWQGWDIVQVERGWTQVIAGATFVGSGVIAISIGLVAGAPRAMSAAQRPREAPVRERKLAARATPGAESPPPAVEPKKAAETVEAEPVAIQEAPPSVTPEAVEAPVEAARPEHPGSWINEALAEAKRHDGVETVVETEMTSTTIVDGAPVVDETVADHTIVGRYTIGGVNYTLHDNGMIEGVGPNGLVRFASLDELRAHIETESRRG